jgi:hypothetical protein
MLLFLTLGIVPADGAERTENLPTPVYFRGMSDASAAVALDDDLFVVADDEQNALKLYSFRRPGMELAIWSWVQHLELSADRDTGDASEADIEGATQFGPYVFWIASHGRNVNGKWRRDRHQFFATRISSANQKLEVRPVGTSYHALAHRLVEEPKFAQLGLLAALGDPREEKAKLAPKKSGFNIEGLTVTADGQSLLIGLRNPQADGKAILIPLHNPLDVVLGNAAPRFGDAVLLDFRVRSGGKEYRLGIRSIEYSPAHQSYLISAGPADSDPVFALYQWSGHPDERPRLLRATGAVLRQERFVPEAIFLFPQGRQFQLLSDDGSKRVRVSSPDECLEGAYRKGFCEQKFLRDRGRQAFGALQLVVQ